MDEAVAKIFRPRFSFEEKEIGTNGDLRSELLAKKLDEAVAETYLSYQQ